MAERVLQNALLILLGFSVGLGIRIRRLDKIRRDLEEEALELDELYHDLKEQDTRIRRKWQSMVDDFSKYNAYVLSRSGKDISKWNEWDDQYLNSWGSAEK